MYVSGRGMKSIHLKGEFDQWCDKVVKLFIFAWWDGASLLFDWPCRAVSASCV